jgi:MFS superfamily sulfate permease-like transporter
LLLHAGWKLVSPAAVLAVWREHRGEALVLLTTAVAIVATSLFEGVLIGLVAAVIRTVWELSRLTVAVTTVSGRIRIRLLGHATFLTVPRRTQALDRIPPGAVPVQVDGSGLGHYDHACQQTVTEWAVRQRSAGRDVTIVLPDDVRHPVEQLT